MLSDRIERWYDRIGIKILYTILVVLGAYIFFKYLLSLFAPFIIAWFLASLLNPFVTFLNQKVKIPRGFGTIISMLTVLSLFFGTLTYLIRQLWTQIVLLKDSFPIYKEKVIGFINLIEENFDGFMINIPVPEDIKSLDGAIESFLNYMSQFLTNFVDGAVDIVKTVPNGVFFTIIMLIATFFMTKDRQMIISFVKAQLPKSFVSKWRHLKGGLRSALGGYVKTQLILMCYTFSICLVGLAFLKREYALLIALGISIFDAIPMFGSGAILIPWGIYYLVIGEYGVGVGLLAIYGIIVVVRQFMEPKVLSGQIGVYGLVTVMAMYIGFKTIGVLGLILGPVTVVMFKTLQKVGIIPDFKPYK